MARYAYDSQGNITNHGIICATDLKIYDKDKDYYCTTPGCTARYHLRSAQKESAAFVSYHKEDHISLKCLVKDRFKSTKYREDLFSLENCFDRILSIQ